MGLSNQEALLDFLINKRTQVLNEIRNRPTYRVKKFAWAMSYYCETSLEAFQNYGDLRFLDFVESTYEEIFRWRDNVVVTKDTYRQRITESWSDQEYLPGKAITHVSIGGRITFPALEFCRIVFQSDLRSKKDVAFKFLDYCIRAVDEYGEDLIPMPSGLESYYFMPEKGEVEAYNHVHSLVNSQIVLWELTSEPRFRDRARDALLVWKHGISHLGGAWTWRLRPNWLSPTEKNSPEYTWKAQITIQSARIAFRSGIMFDRSDMNEIADSFLLLMSDEKGNLYDRMSPKKRFLVNESHPHAGRAGTITGFLSFGQFRPEIFERVQLIFQNQSRMFERGYYTSAATVRALSFRELNPTVLDSN